MGGKETHLPLSKEDQEKLYWIGKDKQHSFIQHPEGEGSDFCKFKLCTKCGCIKEIWRNGTSYILNGAYYGKVPNCL